jgi:heme/copper-type cytochrome/quinol oxidase subunit 1
VTVHGSFFVLAHFHYTIMGGLIFAFFGGLYFWLPKMTGKTMNKKLGKIHFWCMFIFFNMTFFPMFLIGLLGQPRRVFEYAQNLQALNDFASVSAFVLGASFLDLHRQLRLVDLHQADAGAGRTPGTRWGSNGRRRHRCPTTTSSASRRPE